MKTFTETCEKKFSNNFYQTLLTFNPIFVVYGEKYIQILANTV